MRYIISLIILLLSIVTCFTQIPNGGFENWDSIANYEKPAGWTTNQSEMFSRFKKSTFHIEKDFALEIIPSAYSAWHNCESSAFTSFKLQEPIGENKSLYFYFTSTPLEENDKTYLKVIVNSYIGTTFLYSFEWHNDSTVTEFTLHEMPFLFPDADSIKITIIGGALNGTTDGCHYKSISHIDDMKIGESHSNSVIREDLPEFLIYPNPAFEELNILYDENKDVLIKVYNILGNEVFQGVNIHKINISAFKTGIYFVELLELNSNKKIPKKVIFSKTFNH